MSSVRTHRAARDEPGSWMTTDDQAARGSRFLQGRGVG
jgi:hypothetical protein